MKNCHIATLFGELVWMLLTCTNHIPRWMKSGEATLQYVHESVHTIQKRTDLFKCPLLVSALLLCMTVIATNFVEDKDIPIW